MWRWLVVLAGCGRLGFDPHDPQSDGNGPPHEEDGTHSGARLKIVWQAYDSDVRVADGVYDSAIDVTCAISSPDDNGVRRCLPTPMPVVYADASCTQPFGHRLTDCQHEELIASAGRWYRIGAQLAQVPYYSQSLTGCIGPFSGIDWMNYELGEEVPLSAFARVTVTAPATTTRLQPRLYEADDGFRMQAPPYDQTLDVGCVPTRTAAGMSCAPREDTTYSWYQTDASCSRNVAHYPTGLTLRFASFVPVNECPLFDTHYFPATGLSSIPAPYQDIPMFGCTQAGFPSGYSLWDVGPELTLAPMSQTQDSTAARLQRIHLTGDGASWRPTTLYDSVLGVECYTALAADQERHCVPTNAASVNSLFSDAACTQAIEVATTQIAPGCSPAPAPQFGTRSTSAGCDSSVEVVRLAGVHSAAVYADNGLGCALFPPPSSYTTTFYDIAETVPPGAFALATRTIDP